MADYNGSSFETGRLWGQLQGHMHHHGEALERQNEILLDIKDSLNELPSRMAGTMIATPVSASRPPTSLADVTEFLKSLYPPLALLAAILGKAMWPTALPVIRAALEAAVKAGA